MFREWASGDPILGLCRKAELSLTVSPPVLGGCMVEETFRCLELVGVAFEDCFRQQEPMRVCPELCDSTKHDHAKAGRVVNDVRTFFTANPDCMIPELPEPHLAATAGD
jgi:hypothetical protein